jgi:hypothetical protein
MELNFPPIHRRQRFPFNLMDMKIQQILNKLKSNSSKKVKFSSVSYLKKVLNGSHSKILKIYIEINILYLIKLKENIILNSIYIIVENWISQQNQ